MSPASDHCRSQIFYSVLKQLSHNITAAAFTLGEMYHESVEVPIRLFWAKFIEKTFKLQIEADTFIIKCALSQYKRSQYIYGVIPVHGLIKR